MDALKNVSVRTKLLLLISLPIIGLAYFSALGLTTASTAADNATAIEILVEIAEANSNLVHELQKERGASAGFLSSAGNKFGDLLRRQHRATDDAIMKRQQLIGQFNHSELAPVIRDNLAQVDRRLQRLGNIRQDVLGQNIAPPKAIGYYTQNNKILLDIAPKAASISHDAQISQQIQAYYNFLQGKERAGIERAVLSTVFSHNQFTPKSYQKFITLLAEQNSFLSVFETFARSEQVRFYQNAMGDASINDVTRYRNNALEHAETGNFGVDSTLWFKSATERINQLKRVEDQLNNDILTFSATRRDNAKLQFTYLLSFCIGVIVITFGAGFWVISLLTKQVTTLTDTVVTSAQNKDLSVRAQTHSRDELGAAATSLNTMFENFS